jgi:transporter family protein
MSAYLWALLASLVWGCVPFIEKLGLLKLDPVVGLFYRCLGVVVGISMLFIWKAAAIKSSFGELHAGMIYLLVGGFLASVVGQIFFYNALKSGEASMVVPLAASYPLLSFLLGVLFLGEKVTLAKAGGLAFILMGIVLLK